MDPALSSTTAPPQATERVWADEENGSRLAASLKRDEARRAFMDEFLEDLWGDVQGPALLSGATLVALVRDDDDGRDLDALVWESSLGGAPRTSSLDVVGSHRLRYKASAEALDVLSDPQTGHLARKALAAALETRGAVAAVLDLVSTRTGASRPLVFVHVPLSGAPRRDAQDLLDRLSTSPSSRAGGAAPPDADARNYDVVARTVDDLQNAHGVPPDECDAMRAFVAAGADAATLARLAREVARHDHFDATRAAAFARTLGILARRFLPPPPPAKK